MDTLKVLQLNEFEPGDNIQGFYCKEFKQHLKDHFHTISKAHKHDFFLVVYFTHGSGVHEIDFKQYEIKPGSVFMISPGQVHRWEVSDDTEGFVLLHDQSFFDKNYPGRSIFEFPFYQSSQNSPALFISEPSQTTLTWCFRNIVETYSNAGLFVFQKLVALMDLVYLNLSSWYISNNLQVISGVNGELLKIQKLRILIDQYYADQKSATFYARKMNVSSRHLNRVVKATIGSTTTKLITERVILEAKRKLVYETSTLTELAHSLGYHDYAYFSRLFKHQTGISPKEFRNMA